MEIKNKNINYYENLTEKELNSLNLQELKYVAGRLQSASNKRIERNYNDLVSTGQNTIYPKLIRENALVDKDGKQKFSLKGINSKEDAIKHIINNKRFLQGVSTKAKIKEFKENIVGTVMEADYYETLDTEEQNRFWRIVDKTLDNINASNLRRTFSPVFTLLVNVYQVSKEGGKFKVDNLKFSGSLKDKNFERNLEKRFKKVFNNYYNMLSNDKIKDIFDEESGVKLNENDATTTRNTKKRYYRD